ncbi:hypothetical protein L3X38_045479 [Prunus dulcis]|uniref:Uncharacterized protein n=1 Tax=Prunus dulcis TaxID=3755 RepID=A0AAD4YIR9_PRUDU|nr:hypothetical protein L3X38_040735 [Prunus dulcis]KAI5310956.1 hypothetical protein L3X38_045479 [Prunus dulcis]
MFREHNLYFSTAHEENRESTTAPILDFFPQEVTLHHSALSPAESNWLAPFSSSTTDNLLQNDWSPEENDQLSPRCQNQEEEIEPFYEILPSLAPVSHQSPTEKVIQVTSFSGTDNTNEISHDDLISEGTEPTYQLP